MPNSKAMQDLRAAIAAERLAAIDNLDKYQRLRDVMVAYQKGQGPAPTVDEFMQWRNGVEAAVRRRRLDTEAGTQAGEMLKPRT